MSSTEFKLCRRKGITRRVAFPQRPTWNTLAARISELYAIPLDRVAVSYIDADDDEVTLNTQEELTHFYQTCKPSTVVKLFVQDLLALRSRPTGAMPMPIEPLDDEWWRTWEGDAVFVPDLTIRSSQHGFVEEVDSDAEAASRLSSRKSPTNGSSRIDKGKGKAGTSSPALAESTPKPSSSSAGNLAADTLEPVAAEGAHVIDDPPLPSIEPSLPDDLSNFFSSLCNVISSHPEVSESFRNIILNASSGTYWRAHREALSHAAAEVTQASETVMQNVFHDAEVEAGRRVFNALDSVFRTLSTGVCRAGTEPSPSNEAAPANKDGATASPSDVPLAPTPKPSTGPGDKGSAEAQSSIPKQEQAPFVGRSTDWQSFLTPIFPPPPSAPDVHVPRAHTHPFIPSWRFTPVAAPPPPPPPPPFIPPPATGVPSPFPPPEAPLPPQLPRHDFASPIMRDGPFFGTYSTPGSPADPRVAEMAELKAKVHAAKSMYRAEKARYLQEREQARKGKNNYGVELNETGETRAFEGFEGLQSLIDANEGPVTQVISNARGSFPQLGMISIPGPFSPSQRQSSFREGGDDFRSRAVKRICKQLADMGFSESQHPGLADKVSTRLPPNGGVTKDIEDGILTSLLEELLPLASPVASGSGLRSKRN